MAALVYTLPPDRWQQAVDLGNRVTALHFVGVAWELVVLAIMLRLHFGAHLGRWAETVTRWRLAQAYLVVPALLGALWIALAPLSVYHHFLSLTYGLSFETWPAWLAEWLKARALAALVAGFLAWGFMSIARARPRRWWLWGWLASLPVTAFAVFVMPIWIDPLFDRFAPLDARHPQLAAELERLTDRAGMPVPRSRMFEMMAGEKSNTMNAYLTGVGPSKRIVIWDTTIAGLSTPQTLSVFAHELGHYRLRHVPIGVALGLLLALALLWLSSRVAPRGLDGWAALPSILFLAVLLMFLSEPLVNAVSRWQERQADAFEVSLMRSMAPDAGRVSAEVDQIMSERNLENPRPGLVARFWIYDHPSVNERMATAQSPAVP